MSASIYIAAYEILKESIIERIKDFFTNGFDEKGYIIDDKYYSEVLSRNKNHLYASLDWLKHNNVINEIDLICFDTNRTFRNNLAHQMQHFLTSIDDVELEMRFMDMIGLLNKIEKWWILNVEIAIDDEWAGKDIKEDMIIPGPVMTLQIMREVAFGGEEESRKYYEYFKKNFRGT
jgi:hypothetical protein